MNSRGRLILAAVPIGDAADASPRLGEVLATADVIAAEDTRRLRRLLRDLRIETAARVVSYFDGNEAARADELLTALRGGAAVVVVTDAGMPGVSDPGHRITVAAADAGIPVTAVPGPSAVLTALAVSALPAHRFCFEGFPPRRPSARARAFAALAGEPRTLIFFESPRRLAASLADMATAFGADRPAVVCRELTKTHEEVRRGTVAGLAEWATDGVLGEITVVVGGAPPRTVTVSGEELAALVAEREAAGEPRKQAMAAVATQAGVPRRVVYDAVVARKEQ